MKLHRYARGAPANAVAQKIISLPMPPGLDGATQARIVRPLTGVI